MARLQKLVTKGNLRRLQALGNGKMVGVVGAVKATVGMNGWTIRRPAIQQSKTRAFWYKSDAPSCEMEHNGYFGATEAAMTTGCVCFTFDSRGQSQKRLPHADQHLIQGEISRARSRNEKKGVWRRSYKSTVRHLEEVKDNLTKKRGMNWTLEERELDDFWNARAEWRHQLSDAIPSGTCEDMSGWCGQTSPQRRSLVYFAVKRMLFSWMWIPATWKKASGGWPRLKITLMRCSGGRHHMRQNADAIWEAFEFTVRTESSNWKKLHNRFGVTCLPFPCGGCSVRFPVF